MTANEFNPAAFPSVKWDDNKTGMTQFEYFYGQALAGGNSNDEAGIIARQALKDCALVDKSFKNEIDQIS